LKRLSSKPMENVWIFRRLACHRCHHRTGIDPAAQEGAQRYVRHHAYAHRLVEFLAHPENGLGVSHARCGYGRRRRHLPVSALLHRAPLVSEPAARRNAPDGPISGKRVRNVIELKVQAERFPVVSMGPRLANTKISLPK
jgi:hypothetical protein